VFLAVFMADLCFRESFDAQAVSETPVIQIQRGTVIAFFAPAPKGVKEDMDFNEALSDLQFCAHRVKYPLGKLKLDFRDLYVRSFRIHLSGGDIAFLPSLTRSDTI